jgi:hypothetical protein
MNLEIGVIQKRGGPAFAAPWTVAASEQFASRIAQRYLARGLTVSRAELALAYQTPGEVHHFQDTQVNISPQFSLHEHHLFAPVRREIEAGAREARVEKLYERLFSRQERITSFTPPGAPPVGFNSKMRDSIRDRGGNRQGTPPLTGFLTAGPEAVERIVGDAPLQGRAAKPASPQTPDSDSGWGTPIAPVATPKAFTLPAAEVKRVTEQVIREIDHRIVARKERMGRR